MDAHQPQYLMEAYQAVYQQVDESSDDLYDEIVEYLIAEGYAEDLEDADALIEQFDDEEIEGVLDEVKGGGKVEYKPVFRGPSGSPGGRIHPNRRADPINRGMSTYPGHKTADKINQLQRELRKAPEGSTTREKLKTRIEKLTTRFTRDGKGYQDFAEELDTYDLVLDHLISEGYADSEENALKIMGNMSEEWVESIIDEAVRGSQRSIGNIITGNDIRSVTRGNQKVVYKKPNWQDQVETQVRRKMGGEHHRNPFQYGSGLTNQARNSATRLNADPNAEVKFGLGGYEPMDQNYNSRHGYREVPTDWRARRRRASGR